MQQPFAIVTDMKKRVSAAREEVDEAVAYHEVWKPAAFDSDLHERLGKSIAAKGFLVVRTALRREMLLALSRVWDGTKKTIQVTEIARKLSDQSVFDALLLDRAKSMHNQFVTKRVREPSEPSLEEHLLYAIRNTMQPKRAQVIALIEKYGHGGSANNVLEHIKRIRNERLAHRSIVPSPPDSNVTDTDVQLFYEDNLEIMQRLMSLVCATAYDFKETAEVMERHSYLFWAPVKGERTKGHPNYRPSAI